MRTNTLHTVIKGMKRQHRHLTTPVQGKTRQKDPQVPLSHVEEEVEGGLSPHHPHGAECAISRKRPDTPKP